MTRKLMASTALLALMTAGSFSLAQAQTEPAQPEQPALEQPADANQPAATEEAVTGETAADEDANLTPDEPTIASAFMGRAVYASDEPESDNIGDVNDLIIGSDGMITHAVVGVGGFLGIGEKDVAVPFDELQVVESAESGEIRLIYVATKEQLEAAEAFDRTAFDPRQRAAEEQQAADATATDPAAPAAGVAPAETETAMAPASETTATEPVDLDAAAPAETDTAMTADPAAPAETSAAATAETDMAMTAEPATTEPAAGANTTAMTADGGFLSFNAEQMRASHLMGQEVYGADNESIGEVSDLVLQEDGSTRAAIIDVGGFLGVGEKSVAIPFDQLTMKPTEGGTEPRVTVAMTREQLEQAPAFEGAAMDAEQTAAMDPATQPAAGTDPAVTDPNAPAATTADPNMAAEQTAQFEPVTQELSADDLIGSAVIGSNEENLGEVNDVVFDPNGSIEAVVIDVGGFLGVGEKPVAVQYDSLNVQKNGSDDFRLMVNATQEQLEAAPTYNEDAVEAGAQPVQ